MIFEEENNRIKLFDNPTVNAVESEIASNLNLVVSKLHKEIIGNLIKKEIVCSNIDPSILLSYFIDDRAELIKFGTLVYKQETKIDDGEEYPKGEKITQSKQSGKLKSLGPGIGFGITFAIYYHFLKNNHIYELGDYLNLRGYLSLKNFRKD